MNLMREDLFFSEMANAFRMDLSVHDVGRTRTDHIRTQCLNELDRSGWGPQLRRALRPVWNTWLAPATVFCMSAFYLAGVCWNAVHLFR